MTAVSFGTDLSTLGFTAKSDKFNVTTTLAAPSGPSGLVNTGAVNALAGSDTIASTLTLAPGFAGNLTAFDDSDTLNLAAGDDRVHAIIKGSLGDNVAGVFIGLHQRGLLSGDLGQDSILGRVDFTAGANFGGGSSELSGIRVIGTIDTGAANDSVEGVAHVNATSVSGVLLIGLDGGVNSGSPATGPGSILTGVGNDSVTGDARLVATTATTNGGLYQVAGLDDVIVDTGAGRDTLTFKGRIDITTAGDGVGGSTDDGFNFLAIGADGYVGAGATISTGADSDTLTMEGKATVGGGHVGAIGNLDMFVDTGGGRDVVRFNAEASGDVAAAVGGLTTQDINLGADSDTFSARGVAVSANGSAYAAGLFGGVYQGLTTAPSLQAFSLNGDSGQDHISVTARADGASGTSYALGAFDLTFNLGSESDTLTARATVTTGSGDGFAVGLGFVVVNADTGADKVDARGDGGANGNGYGLFDVTLNMGAGDDTVVTRGTTFAITGATINGDAGNDTFDIQTFGSILGVNSVDGGADTDTLKLAGAIGDYTFSDDGTGGVLISHFNGGTTDTLDVHNVERFVFGGAAPVLFADLPIV